MEEKNDGSELGLSKMSINALRSSQQGFEEFQRLFKGCGDLFDKGDDREGMGMLSNELIPKLQDFAEFLASFMGGVASQLSPELQTEFSVKCESYQQILTTLLGEFEKANLTEVGDILRFDMADLVTAMSRLFPKLADDLESRMQG